MADRTQKFLAQPDFPPVLIAGEKRKENGEDSYFCALSGKGGIVGVFDGSGGSGARTYPEFGGKTGAFVASRSVAEAAMEWFGAWNKKDDSKAPGIQGLQNAIDSMLQRVKGNVSSGSRLRSSMTKEFPTTLACTVVLPDESDDNKLKADFIWCGDSRCYLLDADGLHQISVDDLSVKDAFQNLSEDAPLRNVISASHPYTLNQRKIRIRKPCLLFCATDGCFGYLKSPMDFERLMLETLCSVGCVSEWTDRLSKSFSSVAGDDFTLCLLSFGFGSFEKMQEAFAGRLKRFLKDVPGDGKEDGGTLAWWNSYRAGYEKYWPAGNDISASE